MAKETGREEKSGVIQKVLTGVSILLCIVFSFILICNMTIIIKGTLYPERPPSVLGITPMVVLSGSMSGDAEDHIEGGRPDFCGQDRGGGAGGWGCHCFHGGQGRGDPQNH